LNLNGDQIKLKSGKLILRGKDYQANRFDRFPLNCKIPCVNTRSSWRVLVFSLMVLAASLRANDLNKYLWSNDLAFPGLPSVSFGSGSWVAIVSPPGETNRLFLVGQKGNIDVITNLAAPNITTFLNIESKFKGTKAIEGGLLGLAFHPGFATNGYFYVFYMNQTNSAPPTTNWWDCLSRFQTSATDPNAADTNSEVPLFIQYDRDTSHNGGDLHFGSDGYLYVSVGDEGGAYNYYHNAQRIDLNLFSGILRLDVDKRPGNLPPNPSPTSAVTTNYLIPADNPFVGATNFNGLPVDPNWVRTEFWAVGLRNPWRFSFDPVTGLLYCGDVGENTMEEVDIIQRGGNYGWPFYEGTNGAANGIPNPIFPILTYLHGGSIAVIGGVVYRGNRFPEMYGAYIFGTYSGPIRGSFYDGANASPMTILVNDYAYCFGTDPRNGDILFTDGRDIKRLVPTTPVFNGINYSATNLVLSGAGGFSNETFFLLTSSNLVNWDNSFTGQMDSLGNFSVTNSVESNAMQKFYRVLR